MKKAILWLMVWLLPVMLASCSSGGGGGGGTTSDATALTVASQVSVVDAKLTGSVAGVAPLKLSWAGILKALADIPANSDYNNDRPSVYVQERSVEAFNTVNEILCMMAQTKYDTMLNKGAYTAQLDAKQCSSSNSDASSAGQASTNQSSGSDAPQYEMWTVESTRAVGDTAPQYVKVWIHEKARDPQYDQDKTILVKVTITEGKSDTNPIGIFTVNFKGVTPTSPYSQMFWGTLKSERDPITSKILLKFAEEEGPVGTPPMRKQYATLDKATGGDSGAGKVYQLDNWNGTPDESEYNVAFNADFFLRKDVITPSNPDICLNRNAFDQSAWQYGLYNDTTGARINRNSGFPIQVGTAYGWVGYWGLWLPDSVTVNDGTPVNKHDYQTNTNTQYYVFKKGGKLKKHTRHLLALNDIKNIPLNYGEWSGSTGTNYQVVYGDPGNTGTVAFYKTAYMPQNCSDNCFWTNMPSPTPIDLTQLSWGNLNFWSQSLGGQAMVQLENCTQTCTTMCVSSCTLPTVNPTPVVFYAEDIVYPTDTGVPATLACYDNCLQATSSSGIDLTNPYATTWDPMTGQSIQKSYSFNLASMLLTDNTTSYSVVSTTTNSQYQWGFMSGALFDPSAVDTSGKTYLELLACPWNAAQTCGWQAWSVLPEFYTWETGPRDWNQFTALKDSGGAFVKFDPPLQVAYIHSQTTTTAPDYKYNGTKFYLDYSGFGQLNGIPGKCVDDGGSTVSCSKNTRWVPEFMIPAGSTVTAGSATYLAKPLGIEQRMRKDTTGGCASLTVGTYTLPTLADWVDPSTGSDPVTAANDPTATITAPPAVIGGVVQ